MSTQRRLVIESIVLVHNSRMDIVGSNQTKTVFDPEYERFINLEGYDCIGHYCLWVEDFELDIDEEYSDA
jgi:hypothetical protein